MRIVLDTNVLISGIFFGGNPRKVLEKWQEKSFTLLTSLEILAEYEEVLDRLESKSKKKTKSIVAKTVNLLTRESEVILPSVDVHLSRDPDDDKFINCALSGSAIYIVSGDNDLLELKEVQGFEIITAKQFLDRMSI